MRLGSYPCTLVPGTLAHRCYGTEHIAERHRHRWELNNRYRSVLAEKGMVFSGFYTEGDLVEIIELQDHPFFIAVQFHPELKSRPNRPHPLFEALVRAAKEKKRAEALGPPGRVQAG